MTVTRQSYDPLVPLDYMMSGINFIGKTTVREHEKVKQSTRKSYC